jgi:signal transduction histidine kinase
MIDEELLKNLSKDEKETLLGTLNTLISQTYIVENEYKSLRESYNNLQKIITQIIESLPNPTWVLDEKKEIFLQNSKAKELKNLFEKLDLSEDSYEVEINSNIYLINITKTQNKTLLTATNITKQKRDERLASMGQIAAHLAHEIRNPIGSISILSSTLLKKVPLDQKGMVLEIKKAIYRVERIIKSTLLFTKGVDIQKRPIPLKSLEDEIDEAFENYTFSKEIDLKIDFPPKEVYLDQDTFSIVLQNFLYNGIDAIEESDDESGEVYFGFKESKKDDIIVIKDSGVEIKDKNILYEPFATTKLKGHGLGLALSKEIVKAHGGEIKLLEDEKGFEIIVPKENS